MLTIAKELITLGYMVTFVTGSAYKEAIEDTGALLVPIEGAGDFTEKEMATQAWWEVSSLQQHSDFQFLHCRSANSYVPYHSSTFVDISPRIA